MVRTAILALTLVVCAGAADLWLKQVSPIITISERSRYVSLSADEKAQFQKQFWADRAIDGETWFRRMAYADATYGSGALLSGANTDRGRVYLSLGAPSRVTRLPSSRTFVPLEIWYYDDNFWQFLFFSKREGSEPRLYSPTLDGVRALLLPNSSNRGLFPINDVVTESDVRNRLTLGPVEEEVLEPAMRVSKGITGVGNDELTGLALSPSQAVNHGVRTRVRSQLVAAGESPAVDVTTTAGTADVAVNCSVRAAIRMQLLRGAVVVDDAETSVPAASRQSVQYLHRYLLPPGEYTVRAECDGRPAAAAFRIADSARSLVVGVPIESAGPFSFGGGRLIPGSRPTAAAASGTGDVRWKLRKGNQVVWSATTSASDGWARTDLPANLAPGAYELEAGDAQTRFNVGPAGGKDRVVISYRANLNAEFSALLRSRVLLSRGDGGGALATLRSAESTDAVLVSRARILSLTGDLDGSRTLLVQVLARSPRNAEALAAMGFISYEFQDYVMAERYLRQAADINPGPALRTALLRLQEKTQTLRIAHNE